MTRLADLSFGLDRYAAPILSVLSTFEPDFAEFDETAQMYDVRIHTHQFFAGNRRWAALVLYPQLAPSALRTVVLFGRDPSEDGIVVETWAPLMGFRVGEGPTVEDAPAQVSRRRFQHSELVEATEYVRRELAQAYRAMRASRAVTGGIVSNT